MATITELRDRFRAVSGRADLTTAEITKYLNRGQMYLDEITDFSKAPQKYQISVLAGQVQVTFPARCRVVQGVWVADTESQTELIKIDEAFARLNYNGPVTSLERARPIHFVDDPLTYNNASGLFAWGTATMLTAQESSGILIFPPPEKDYEIEVQGRFYSPTLSDTQSSWWLAMQDSTLLKAALRELETDYRNTQGVKDWDAAMSRDVNSIQDDEAEAESVGISRMEG